MSKAEWGVKRRCANGDARFYDMQRTPIRCPKCDTIFVVTAMSAAPARGPRSRAMRPYVPATFGASAAEPNRDGWTSEKPTPDAADEVEESDDEVAADEDEDEVGLEVDGDPEDEAADAEDEADKPER